MSIFTNPGKVLAEDEAAIASFFTNDAWPAIKTILVNIENMAIPIVQADAVQDAAQVVTGVEAGQSISTIAAQAGANILAQGVALGQKAALTAAQTVQTELTTPATTSTAS